MNKENVQERLFEEYTRLETKVEILEEVYISLKHELTELFEDDYNKVNEIINVSSRIAKTLEEIDHIYNALDELRPIVYTTK